VAWTGAPLVLSTSTGVEIAAATSMSSTSGKSALTNRGMTDLLV
jgi:hypothetical protein